MAAQVEELLAHQIDVGNHDGVHRPAVSLPLYAGRQDVTAVVRLVRRDPIDRDAEHAALDEVVKADRAGIGAGLEQGHEGRHRPGS